MSHLQGTVGKLDMVVSVKRVATGKTETYNLSSELTPEQLEQLRKDFPEHEVTVDYNHPHSIELTGESNGSNS